MNKWELVALLVMLLCIGNVIICRLIRYVLEFRRENNDVGNAELEIEMNTTQAGQYQRT